MKPSEANWFPHLLGRVGFEYFAGLSRHTKRGDQCNFAPSENQLLSNIAVHVETGLTWSDKPAPASCPSAVSGVPGLSLRNSDNPNL